MKIHNNSIYHIYNRSNNQETLFRDTENYEYFALKVKKHLTPHAHILCYCLMPNHFHLMVYVRKNTNTSQFKSSIGVMLSSYTKSINKKYSRKGSLFQQHTKAADLSFGDNLNQKLICFLYIHQNPLKANLVRRVDDCPHSSFREYFGNEKNNICDIDLAKRILALPQNKSDFHKLSYCQLYQEQVTMLYNRIRES